MVKENQFWITLNGIGSRRGDPNLAYQNNFFLNCFEFYKYTNRVSKQKKGSIGTV